MILLRYDISSAEFTGTCGATGTVIWTTLLFILNFAPCPFPADQCVQDLEGVSHM